MANLQNIIEKNTPVGGIFHILEHFSHFGALKTICRGF